MIDKHKMEITEKYLTKNGYTQAGKPYTQVMSNGTTWADDVKALKTTFKKGIVTITKYDYFDNDRTEFKLSISDYGINGEYIYSVEDIKPTIIKLYNEEKSDIRKRIKMYNDRLGKLDSIMEIVGI